MKYKQIDIYGNEIPQNEKEETNEVCSDCMNLTPETNDGKYFLCSKRHSKKNRTWVTFETKACKKHVSVKS